ncbi:hypothetical protein [uncultured Abyssibacter sp.]
MRRRFPKYSSSFGSPSTRMLLRRRLEDIRQSASRWGVLKHFA